METMTKHFNYISFGDPDYVEGVVGDVAMSRERMFEHTPTDLKKRLESLAPSAISFFQELPTFLCSEIQSDEAGKFMLIKYGRISNIIAKDKEVSAAFISKIDFGKVRFNNLEAASSIFGANKFQLYRTHWAVREGDAKEIVNRLAEIKPERADLINNQPDTVNAESLLPQRDKKIIGIAGSVESFLKLIYDSSSKENTKTFFRGHEDARYELTPSLLRKLDNGDWKHMPFEDKLCKELLIAHYDEFQGDQSCFDRLVRMQHYGLPTRLLDISSNPLMALFFACTGEPKTRRIKGEVILFKISSEKMKYYDSDTVSCLANLSNLTYEQKDEIEFNIKNTEFNKKPIIQKLLHHIKSEKGFFEPRIIPDDLKSIICVKAKHTNTRIKSQSGAFLLFGHGAELPDAGQDGIEISRITIRNKKKILDQLDQINIKATTAYPSIDKTAIHLREQHQSPEPEEQPRWRRPRPTEPPPLTPSAAVVLR
jgi:hypothetical protein